MSQIGVITVSEQTPNYAVYLSRFVPGTEITNDSYPLNLKSEGKIHFLHCLNILYFSRLTINADRHCVQ